MNVPERSFIIEYFCSVALPCKFNFFIYKLTKLDDDAKEKHMENYMNVLLFKILLV